MVFQSLFHMFKKLLPYALQTQIGIFITLVFILFGLYISNTEPRIGATWIVGGVFGLILQRSRLCFASAFRDIFLFGSGHNMKGILLGLSISAIGFTAIMYWLLPNTGVIGSYPSEAHILPSGISVIIGGVLFGFGMVIAGGCVSGTLYRIAEGYITSWITLVGILIGLILLTISWNWWWDNLISKEPRIWLPNLFDGNFGYTWALFFTLLLLLFVYLFIVFIESRNNIFQPVISKKINNQNNFVDRVNSSLINIFKKGWPIYIGTTALGGLAVLSYLIHTPLGVTGELMSISHRSMSLFSINIPELKGLSDISGCIGNMDDSSVLTYSFAMTIGLLPGAFVGALFSGEFKIRIPNKDILLKRFSQSFFGGIFMGYSSGLALGCTIGAFFSAIPSLSLSGWIFALSLAFGAFIGTKIIKRIG